MYCHLEVTDELLLSQCSERCTLDQKSARKGSNGQKMMVRDFAKKDASWLFFKKKSTGESECLCMDGKEVTCASAPPAKFRSAKGIDYAGKLLLKKLFCLSFFPSLQETGEVRGRKRVERI